MKTILIQLDTDPHPSTFDRVVAIDAGAEELFSYGGVTPDNVTGLVHGAMFTRGPGDLKNTAIFIGGSQVEAGEALLKKVTKLFFGPIRVSVMMDSNGSNTTAAAAVRAAARHLDPGHTTAVILGGTGPVGHRAAQILASLGATVHVSSRSKDRAEATCAAIRKVVPEGKVSPCGLGDEALAALEGAQFVIAAGAAGVEFFDEATWSRSKALQVAIDLNAVAPAGLGGIGITDKAVSKDGTIRYGAIGVGGTKMKIHRAAVQKLFESNDAILDTAAIYEIAKTL
ncbi:NAD(P)-dependent methylenetetrahydromethanopterin dehydrogenase [Planctomyces sp. SH-PL14]|uniref:NAD(P)-dependent methylenetetrahydromethanopterin dehydrogenase n=1 Tax=Planctomyces sp. SH-PL14 TaxID=1632864 RepID=UPI00078D1C1D|nr:NAD(P)-dependent methylenetetrahydromethanopterin dehydrogenase [Planctomyces sp. SH-PL14]AMV22545.1 Bifunctional protein MdtA [Planctomyces sp. SH-PL14]